jgi:hypothetical protein
MLFSLLLTAIAGAQVANDFCSDARLLSLGQAPPCLEDGISALAISASNTGATPSLPDLRLSDSFGTGQTVEGPLADVWFVLQASANRLQIELEGELQDPVLVLFQAQGDCDAKFPVALSRSSGSLLARTEPGQRYLLMVGGGELADQGDFSLHLAAYNDCSTCAGRRGRLQVSPAPEAGAYLPGQTVQFCYEITLWTPGQALEWLHALQVQFGPGWDRSTLQTQAPQACSAPYGQWGWYDSWQSCMSGQTFGPGFAFDSQWGLLCGGAPFDGDPGNNYGDGLCGNPASAGPLPLEFCWTIQVKDDFSTGEPTELNLQLALLGDGYSASWMPEHCGVQATADFLAVARPPGPLEPLVTLTQIPCLNNCNGILSISGVYSGNAWSYTLRNGAGNTVFSGAAINGSLSLGNICPGDYELTLANAALGIEHRIPIEVPARDFPGVDVGFELDCALGVPVRLRSNGTGQGQFVVHAWQGPGGFFSTQVNPAITAPGRYELTLIVDGCAGQPIEVEVPRILPELSCVPDSEAVLFTWDALPQDTAYRLELAGGQTGIWLSETAFLVQGLAPGELAELELTVLGEGLCPEVTVAASCAALECTPLDVAADVAICAGGQAQLWVDAPVGSSIEWSPAATLSCADCPDPIAQPAATTDYTAAVLTPSGCAYTVQTTVYVNSLPPGALPAEPVEFCLGEAFSICLPPGNSYVWMSPFGFVTTGSCLTVVNPTAHIAGLYRIQVRLPGGCRFTETLRLQIGTDCGGSAADLAPVALPQAPDGPAGLAVYPNPASDYFELSLPAAEPTELILSDLSGRPVRRLHVQEQQTRMSLEGLPGGVYLLQAITPQGRFSQRVAVVRF